MLKLADGWHHVPGDPETGKRKNILPGAGGKTSAGHYHYWLHVYNGELRCLLPLSEGPGTKAERLEASYGSYVINPGSYGENYMRECEKAWGETLEQLFAPPSNGLGKVVAWTLGGAFAAGFLSKLAKNAKAKAEAQKKLQEQKQEAK